MKRNEDTCRVMAWVEEAVNMAVNEVVPLAMIGSLTWSMDAVVSGSELRAVRGAVYTAISIEGWDPVHPALRDFLCGGDRRV